MAALDDLTRGQAHTFTGERGEKKVILTTGEIYDAVLEGMRRACGAETVDQIDLEGVDHVAVAQNTCCAVEEAVGIYPNIRRS